ncbi:MAG: thiamine biosynthesis lipoprotein [Candidatus Paceibacteria bacterium]|jgi:thiamine biosynthesis lipoprotein
MKFSFEALGTTWWIELFEDLENANLDEVKNFVEVFVSAYEKNYSRFLDDSQISVLNRERTFKNPSLEFVQLLEYGKRLYLRSDTHFNLLTGHILESKGYNADYTFTDSGSAETAGNPITDLSITSELIELKHGNIDLGGYGKGYLIDLIATEFRQTLHIEQFIINGGGDIYATHSAGEPITIFLEHPTQTGTGIAKTTLINQGFAASSPHKRVWKNETGEHTHIISDQLTSDATFIKAKTASDADAFATTALQLNQTDLEKLAKSEQLGIALFDISSGRLVASQSFG